MWQGASCGWLAWPGEEASWALASHGYLQAQKHTALDGDLLDEGLASSKSSMFRAIVGEGGEGGYGKLNVRPVNLPEAFKIPHIK